MCVQAQPGPFIKLGPLRNVAETAEKAGCLSAAGLVVILALALTAYGTTSFQQVLVTTKWLLKEVYGYPTLPDPRQGRCPGKKSSMPRRSRLAGLSDYASARPPGLRPPPLTGSPPCPRAVQRTLVTC